jgi:hypothetical protein
MRHPRLSRVGTAAPDCSVAPLTSSDPSQRTPTPAPAEPLRTASGGEHAAGGDSTSSRDRGGQSIARGIRTIGLVFAAATLVCVLAYLAATVPGRWFPGASPKSWTASELTLVRGAGARSGDELVLTAPDAGGIALVTVTSEIRADDYAAVAWLGSNFPEIAEVGLLWRSDNAPDRVNSVRVPVAAGRLQPVLLQKNPAWRGRISGLALVVRGALPQPVRIHGVVAKPMGAVEIIGDRAGEWLAFEPWSGTSINTVTGGTDDQDLPLPLLLACAVALASGAVLLIRRRAPRKLAVSAAGAVLAVFVIAWAALDVRWTWNLVRQVRATSADYAGRNTYDRHLAAEDGPLFAFIEKARAILPAKPVRIFVVADADYFRSRAAYHLYPHNVYADPRRDLMPDPAWLRPGDWLLVYQRHGVQFNAAEGKLRWNETQTVAAEARLVAPGAALFLIR